MTDTQTPQTPPLLGRITPYLVVDGALEAIEHYKQALGAELIGEAYLQDGKVLNARVDINGGSVMLMDPQPQAGGSSEPAGFNLNLTVEDADAWFERAVAAGCTVVLPIGDQFWGDRYASA